MEEELTLEEQFNIAYANTEDANTEEPQIHEEIPVNSESLHVDEATSRFSGAIWYEEIQRKSIILAGLGGIGSFVAFLLARMKPRNIFLYDSDTVETVNMSGQLYGTQHIGSTKVSATQDVISEFADYHNSFGINDRYTSDCDAADIMICGFDNMEARKTFFNSWKNHIKDMPAEKKKKCLFIDGRLAAEEFQVFCITGDDDYHIKDYQEKWLFTDEEADATVCSYKQTTFCANMIASIMVNLFVNFCANGLEGDKAPLMPRDLPFLTEYSAETMFFKTEL